jgi:hypothetical protein
MRLYRQDPLNTLRLACGHDSWPLMIWGRNEQSLLAERSADGSA